MQPVNLSGISVKGTAGVLGGAVASLVWTLLAAFVPAVKDLEPSVITGLTGATALVVGTILFYVVPESAAIDTTDAAAADEPDLPADEVDTQSAVAP